MDDILNINDTNKCYYCGAHKVNTDNSLHVWSMEYECGSQIWGPITTNEISLGVECPNEAREKKLKRICK